MSAKPTRERVAAYEKALGCWTLTPTEFRRRICFRHQKDEWTDLGCPVAVAAARVEAERIAEVEGALAELGPETITIALSDYRTERQRADAAEAELASLRAVVEQVRALHTEYVGYEHSVICKECGDDMPCATLALLPEATS